MKTKYGSNNVICILYDKCPCARGRQLKLNCEGDNLHCSIYPAELIERRTNGENSKS